MSHENRGGDGSGKSRRTFLKTSAGTAALAAFAGCAGDGGGNGNGNGNGGGTSGNGDGSTSTPQGMDGGTFMTSIGNTENAYWDTFAQGAMEAAEQLGLEHEVRAHDFQVSNIISQIQNAESQGWNGINAFAQEGQVRTFGERAVQRGIPLTMIWNMAPWSVPMDYGEEFVMYHMADSVNTGYWVTKMLLEALDGSGSIARIEGTEGAIFTDARRAGSNRAIEEYSDIELLSHVNNPFTRKGGRDSMSTLLSRHGTDIDGVISQHTIMALGAITILKQQRGEVDIPITGVDALPDGNQAIENGDLTGAHCQHPPWQGGWAVVQMYDYLNGVERKAPERMTMWGGDLLAQNPDDWDLDYNVLDAGAYNDVVYGEGGSPWDFELMSRAESGEDWDPQNWVRPFRKKHFSASSDESKLFWDESEKPDGYSLPDVYDDTALFDEVAQMYEEQFESNPLYDALEEA